ncbi:unnamed protein product [Pieris macdunnoughi]|uniref:Uncharacterized protein n=1 Tax=Pieris macdunnoughi TaxID=345717 RepID=A0A821UVK8_9NEOP|nr:unnamed protein product [Pieris macdunnoughi]
MDQITNFLVYNKTPTSRNSMKYEALRTKRGKSLQGDKQDLLLSPILNRMADGKWCLSKILIAIRCYLFSPHKLALITLHFALETDCIHGIPHLPPT